MLILKMENETSAKILTERAFLKHPQSLVEEKYGIEYEEFTNPAACSCI